MAFTVEDGTGLAAANAYISVAEGDDYFTDRGGNAIWTASPTGVKQAGIIKATDYIETRFGHRFLGSLLITTQALSFPRQYLYDRYGNLIEGLPRQLKHACAEYAVRAISAALWNEPHADPKGRRVVERNKVGPIEEDIRYVFNEPISTIKPVPVADNLLKSFMLPANTVMR
jgi:hypothetical protein